MHYATMSQRVDAIDLVLNAGFGDIDVRDYQGQTPMHHAAKRNNTLAMQKLVELGGGHLMNAPDADGIYTNPDCRVV